MILSLKTIKSMKVKCKTNKAEVAFKGKSLPFGTASDSVYGVDIDVIYTVLGMVIWKKELSYLIYTGDFIELCPYQLFEVINPKLSNSWFFKSYSLNDGYDVEAVWGYYEFCFDEEHYENVVSNNREGMDIFFKRKKQIEDED